MTDSRSRNRSQTYRFDVSVRMGPLLSLDICKSFTEILRAAETRIQLNGLEKFPSPTLCLTTVTVLRILRVMCTSIQSHVCTNLLSRFRYPMIESIVKLNGRPRPWPVAAGGSPSPAGSPPGLHLVILFWQRPAVGLRQPAASRQLARASDLHPRPRSSPLHIRRRPACGPRPRLVSYMT